MESEGWKKDVIHNWKQESGGTMILMLDKIDFKTIQDFFGGPWLRIQLSIQGTWD